MKFQGLEISVADFSASIAVARRSGEGVRRFWRRSPQTAARPPRDRRETAAVPPRPRRSSAAERRQIGGKPPPLLGVQCRRPDRLGANLHGACSMSRRGRRKKNGRRRSGPRATREILRCPRQAYSGPRRSAAVSAAVGGGLAALAPRPPLATTSVQVGFPSASVFRRPRAEHARRRR